MARVFSFRAQLVDANSPSNTVRDISSEKIELVSDGCECYVWPDLAIASTKYTDHMNLIIRMPSPVVS